MKDNEPNKYAARIIYMILILNIVGLSIFVYYNIGSFSVHTYLNKHPVYIWIPSNGSIILSISLIIISSILFLFSYNPSMSKLKFTLLLALISLILGSILSLYYYSNHPYVVRTPLETDARILEYAAAKDILSLRNPYLHDYKDYLTSLLPPDPYTFYYRDPNLPFLGSEIEGYVTRFDYLPAAAYYYLPAAALGISPSLWDGIVTGIAFALILRKLPGVRRPLFLVTLSVGSFLFMASLFGRTGTSGWFTPLLASILYLEYPLFAGLFLAFSVLYRVYVGVFALFLLIVAHKEGYDLKKLLAYSIFWGLALISPFLLTSRRAMFEAFLIPYKLNLNPLSMGPGLSSLGFFNILFPKIYYTALVIGTVLLGLVLSWRHYDKFKQGIFAFPTLAMFFYYRPSYIYYVYFLYIGLIAYVTGVIGRGEEREEPEENKRTYWRLSLASLVISATGVILTPVSSLGITVRVLIPIVLVSVVSTVFLLELLRRDPPNFDPNLRNIFIILLIFTLMGLFASGLKPVTYLTIDGSSIKALWVSQSDPSISTNSSLCMMSTYNNTFTIFLPDEIRCKITLNNIHFTSPFDTTIYSSIVTRLSTGAAMFLSFSLIILSIIILVYNYKITLSKYHNISIIIAILSFSYVYLASPVKYYFIDFSIIAFTLSLSYTLAKYAQSQGLGRMVIVYAVKGILIGLLLSLGAPGLIVALLLIMRDLKEETRSLLIEIVFAAIIIVPILLFTGLDYSYLYGNELSKVQTLGYCPLSLISQLVPIGYASLIPWLYTSYFLYEYYRGIIGFWKSVAYMSLPIILLVNCAPEVSATLMYMGTLATLAGILEGLRK